MGKILEFRSPAPKPLSRDQYLAQELTPKEAIDMIIVGLVGYILPIWVEQQWPFRALEIMAEELRSAMSLNVPSSVSRNQVLAIVEELKPIWHQIAEASRTIF